MAIGEQRYLSLFASLKARLEELLALDESAAHDAQSRAEITAQLELLEDHFSNAMSLLDISGRQRDSVPFSLKLMEAAETPAALVDREGRVVNANAPASELLGFERGSFVPPERFEPGQHKNFLSNLSKIEEFAENKVVSLFGFYGEEADDPLHIAMMRVDLLDGETLGYLELAKINWLPEKAAHFQALFGLTPTEMDITKGLVNGRALSDIAERCGRSLGTVRQQVKKLLSKLELRSQTELICLYSGVVKYDGPATPSGTSGANMGDGSPDEGSPAPQIYAISREGGAREGGRLLEYELFGKKSATPILALPSLLGGSAIPANVARALADNNLRLIMPWRPLLGGCGSSGPPKLERFADYARDIEALLDHLQVERVAVMGHITSAMFAYALAKYLPDRITHVVNVNGIIPVNSGAHVKMLNAAERLRFHIHRHLPKIASMVMHSMLKVVDSGQDQEFLHVFLQKNPEDLETIQCEDVQATFRRSHDHITRNGFAGFSHELSLASLDWQYLMEDLPAPVLNLVGAKNLSFTPALLRTFEAEKGIDLGLEVIERGGHLALYQRPDAVFARIARFMGLRDS